jgi:predicted CXXCH cytochrome family protein
VLSGISGKGHPFGDARAARDPLRPGTLFYCGSCHEPHGADHARLIRFDTSSIATFCLKCHRY